MDREAYETFHELDTKHFWRIGKRLLILDWLGKYLPRGKSLNIMDIGGACSVMSSCLSDFGAVTVIEPDQKTVEFARTIHQDIDIRIGKLPDGLPDENYDLVTLFDVLEHLDDDRKAINTIFDLLNEGGYFLLTVPALMNLWSVHDISLHHKRRYTLKELEGLLISGGFKIIRASYYTSLLFPVLYVDRKFYRLKRRRNNKATYDVKVPNPLINSTFGYIMRLERWLLRLFDFPIGSSLIVFAKK